MIDEKKLIEDIWKQSNNHITEWSTGGILALIEQQPQVDKCSDCSRRKFYQQGYQDGLNERKWIPCEERLPDKRGNYLVCSKGVTWVANWFLDTWWGIEKRCRYSDVEAWQPLPQPYKKEGNANENI